ncbi:MAG: LuxR C-terminal-related transcriptional regulator [Gordonia sp. (in: high G+C Gram-positive bacteria)]|uniref:LuxR C-terminal-related transcriptional regulator n=1 Tax=Gordonia sp. (in: high G+C Gram-positive bacteria) TaxID=84139 RepID=UPI0039E47612
MNLAGRSAEMAAASIAIADDSGVAGPLIVGDPGVGKTALAGQVARQRAGGGSVRWVAGSDATRSIPLGALGHLVSVPGEMDQIAMLADAQRALAAEASSPLVIDDAHLLDQLSAIVVQQYALARRGPLVVTARVGDPLPEPIALLWKDSHLRRIRLAPFSPEQSEELLVAALSGEVEPELAEQFHRFALGSPLVLTNLVRVAAADGTIEKRNGRWHLNGPLAIGADLAELFAQRLAGLTAQEREVLEMVALADRLDLDTIVAVGGIEAVAALEDRRLLVVDDGVARVEHPLLAEVVRDRAGAANSRALRGRLAEHLGRRGPDGAWPDARTLVRAARLRKDSDLPVDIEQACTAASRATAMAALDVGEELARWAMANGGGLFAALVLGDALTWQGRGSEVEELIAPYAEQGLGELIEVRVAVLRAVSLYWNAGRPDAALDLLAAAREHTELPAAIDVLDGVEAQMKFFLGEALPLLETAPRLLAKPDALPAAAVSLAGTTAIALGLAARMAELRATVERSAEFAAKSATGLLQFNAAVGMVFGDVLAGDLCDAERELVRWRQRAGGEPSAEAIVDMLEGRVALARGDFDTAVRLLRVTLTRRIHSGWLLLAAHFLTMAEFERGDADAASAACAQMEAEVRPNLVCYHPARELTRALAAAARGNITGARDSAIRAANQYRSQHAPAAEVFSLHLAVRVGDRSPARRLADLHRSLDNPFSEAAMLHARGLADHDAAKLLRAAAAFEAIGFPSFAADAAAHAVVEADEPEAAREFLNRLVSATGQGTPAVRAVRRSVKLTTREEDVTALVVAGLSNKEIARELGVSVRTVEGHLYRVYTKTGVTERSALRLLM